MNHKKLSALALLVAFAAGALVLASRLSGSPFVVESAGSAAPAPRPDARPRRPYPARVLAPRLPPQLRIPFRALGDRLERPGNERLLLSGSLTLEGGARRENVQVLREFPGVLVVTRAGGAQLLASFDDRKATSPRGGGGASEELLVETFFYDSAEHFFFAQVRGAATRFLGSGHRPEDGAYGVPTHDVYEVTEEDRSGDEPRERTRRYFFNTDTQLLEAVRYDVERQGLMVAVEVRIGGWRKVGGQMLPGRVERLEDGRRVLELTINSAQTGPRPAVVGGGQNQMPST